MKDKCIILSLVILITVFLTMYINIRINKAREIELLDLTGTYHSLMTQKDLIVTNDKITIIDSAMGYSLLRRDNNKFYLKIIYSTGSEDLLIIEHIDKDYWVFDIPGNRILLLKQKEN